MSALDCGAIEDEEEEEGGGGERGEDLIPPSLA